VTFAHQRAFAILSRIGLFLAALLLLVSALISGMKTFAAEPEQEKFSLDVANVAPRAIEETTEKAILREYSAAWKVLTASLRDNRADQLGPSFVGTAHDAITKQVEQQKKAGLSVRINDLSHKLDAVFYSPEGSAMQLRDIVELEKEYLDGGKVVHSEKLTQQYVVLMSVAEDRWKVRLLQEVQ
jgi:hypothetical protein